jgi:phosphotriesterase-related protein
VPRVKKVAERTSVNVIVATGWYTWHDLPPFFTFRERYKGSLSRHVDTLEDFFVRDIEDGIADTGVRAGIIKCVTDRYGLTEDVRTAIRAAAGAHRRTGVPITTHTGIGIGLESGRLQIQALTEDGVDVSRVNIGHIDFTPPEVPVEEFEEFLQHGSFISFDAVALKNQFPDDVNEARLHRVVELSARGYAPQIMLSNGDSIYDDLLPQEYYDRTHPFPVFSELSLNFIPALLERGVSKADIDLMTRENPRRYFETTAMGSY